MTTRNWTIVEIAALLAASALFLATFRIRPAYVDFLLAGAAVALIAASAPRSRRLWTAVPLSPDAKPSQRAAWLATAAFTGAALVALAGLGTFVGLHTGAPLAARFLNVHLPLAILLYFPWALLQQYIFQFYLCGRLLQLLPLPLAVVFTAAAFASVHFPRWPVMAVTLLAGTVWTLTYLRWRQLTPLAVSHAILGAALHYWVFNHDLLETWTLFH